MHYMYAIIQILSMFLQSAILKGGGWKAIHTKNSNNQLNFQKKKLKLNW